MTSQAPTPGPNYYSMKLDSGSNQNYIDASGNNWLADQSYSVGSYGYTQGGQVVTSSANITGTNSPALYQIFREGSNLSYSFSLPMGHYQVTLKFVDLISTAAGQNVFNVAVQGDVAAQNLDIYKAVGQAVATDRTFRINVTNTSPVTIQLSAVQGMAFVSAIEISGLQPSTEPVLNYFFEPGGTGLMP